MFETLNWVDWVTISCVILCYLISGYQVLSHLNHYTNPKFQNKIIMILFMSPIYATLSSFAIWTDDSKGYFLLLRDIYESIVIYSFFELLRACIAYDPTTDSYDERRIYIALGNKGPHPHTFPVNCFLPPMNLTNELEGQRVFKWCKAGILQYIPIKICCAFMVMLDYWELGSWQTGEETIYYICSVAVAISVTVALYWLVFFFHIMHEELKHIKPLMKFVTIKGALFFMFWQEIALWVFDVPLKHSRFLPPQDVADADEVMSSILVNIEMVIMSLLTSIAFSHMDFVRGTEMAPKGNITDVLRANVDETWHQMKEVVVAKDGLSSGQGNQVNLQKGNESSGQQGIGQRPIQASFQGSTQSPTGNEQGGKAQAYSQFADHRQGFH